MLSELQGFQQKMHVDMDYKWSGENPNQLFEIQREGKYQRAVFHSIFRAYSAVYKARHIATDFVMAVKCIPIEEDGLEGMEKEIEILKTCRSSNIVSYFGTCVARAQRKLWVGVSLFRHPTWKRSLLMLHTPQFLKVQCIQLSSFVFLGVLLGVVVAFRCCFNGLPFSFGGVSDTSSVGVGSCSRLGFFFCARFFV